MVITMRLSQIRDFVAVVESGGIRAAARKLGVSQPAITRSVRGLEAELHARLLQRTPTGVVLTQPGRAFLARARAAQAELRKAEEELDRLDQKAGSVAFGVSPTSAILVPEAVNCFRQQFPQTRVHIAEGLPQLLLPLVRDETLDFAICRRAEANWVSLLPAAAGGPLDRVFSQSGLSVPQQVIQCESYNTAIGLIAKTDMLGFLSRQALGESVLSDFLREIPVTEPMPSFIVGVFTRADTPLTQLAGAMANAITAA